MPDVIQVKLEGGRELAKYLKEIGLDLAMRKMKAALKKGAVLVRDDAKARAPIDTEPRTFKTAGGQQVTIQPGTLQRSIGMAATKSRGKESVGWAIGPTKEHGWWAMFVELGTEHSSAQPFLRGALRSQKDAAIKRISAFLGRSMKRYNNKKRRASG